MSNITRYYLAFNDIPIKKTFLEISVKLSASILTFKILFTYHMCIFDNMII